ncbi:MAG: TetR family transcriptional regulator [Christensenellaceae bacterium]|nr:TetR family transcriptional regulator [Christensenellaceae bacterium]
MPPVIRYTRDAVLSAAFELVRRDGLSALNARAVAQELGSSTQPIFRLFSGMDELRAGVIELAQEMMKEYMLQALRSSDTPYLTVGLSYVHFARDESELFKLLFMHDTTVDIEQMLPVSEELVSMIQQHGDFTVQQAKVLHGWLWIFTHGLAVSIATKACCISEERLLAILKGAYEAAALKLKQDIRDGIV